LLSEDQKQEIFLAALKVLERTGVQVFDDEALQILKDLGARVEGNQAWIPPHLVQEALRTAPRRFTVYSRSGDSTKDIDLAPNWVYYGPGPTPPNFRDPRTYERRKYVRADARSVARVCDALTGISFVQSLGTVSDVHPDLADVYEFAEMIANTDKPIVSWSYDVNTCKDIHQIGIAVAGGEEAFHHRPNYIFYAEPLSPLVSSEEAAQKLVYCAKNRIPLVYTPCPMCGGTAAATYASILVTAIAESLHGLVIAQALNPGTPFIMGGVVSVMDMQTSILAYGAPELSLLSAGLTEMARYVGVPVWSTAGCTDSKLLDEQAAIEGTLSILFAGLSGANLVHDVGYTDSALTGSLHQLVMMDEAINMVRRILRGIEINEETLALDVIDHVGPGGHFLSEDHTLKFFRTEFWYPTLMDRQRRSDWEAMGRPSLGDRVQQRLNHILDTHEPVPLPPGVQEQIDAVLAAAEERVAGQ
ncbi:MAG TPA: trimethylamine methyltransferase, partial [Anaerolineae bacterium]|nr:trimethylamine methyltransferase [Anaerolineae bacterium]